MAYQKPYRYKPYRRLTTAEHLIRLALGLAFIFGAAWLIANVVPMN
jgi:hypothetical protein